LVVAAADALRASFPHGVYFIDLTAATSADQLIAAIGGAIGVLDRGDRPRLEVIKEYVGPRHLLLVLDNFEHLLTAAPVVGELLAAGSGLVVLTTTRTPLHLRWEHLVPVEPLPVPRVRASATVDQLATNPSVMFFAMRAQAADSGFVLTEENAEAVAEIVTRLDGIPLAIELAAAQVPVSSPHEILDRLQRRLPLVPSHAADAPVRHQTLESAVAWSYARLDANEQRLFRLTSVFAGGWTLEAAVALANESSESAVLDRLAALVDKSLVHVARHTVDGPRFGLTGPVQEYARERLRVQGELGQVAKRQAAYFTALAERAEAELRGPKQREWLDRLEADAENLSVALEWASANGDAEAGLRLTGALGRFWRARGRVREGGEWLEYFLARSPDTPTSPRVLAQIASAEIALLTGRAVFATGMAQAAVAGARALQNHALAVRALTALGGAMGVAGNLQGGIVAVQEGVRLARECGDHWGTGWALRTFAELAWCAGELEQARTAAEECLALLRTQDPLAAVGAFATLALVADRNRDEARAAALLVRGVQLATDIGAGRTLVLFAELALILFAERIPAELGARLVSAVEEFSQWTDGQMFTCLATAFTEVPARLRGRLDENRWSAAWRDGRMLTLDQFGEVVLALLATQSETAETATSPAATGRTAGELSNREREVLRLVAEGLSNKEIGKALFITEATAKFHVRSILKKLGANTRTHAIAVAHKRGVL
jgi:non-specific serine/threonine protein kinase